MSPVQTAMTRGRFSPTRAFCSGLKRGGPSSDTTTSASFSLRRMSAKSPGGARTMRLGIQLHDIREGHGTAGPGEGFVKSRELHRRAGELARARVRGDQRNAGAG